jgi:hypothetical protein
MDINPDDAVLVGGTSSWKDVLPGDTSKGLEKFRNAGRKVAKSISPELDSSGEDASGLMKEIFSVEMSHTDLERYQEDLEVTRELANLIDTYHNITKTDYDLLPRRAYMLFCICKMCLEQKSVLEKTKATTAVVDSIFRCAAAKHNYITQLFKKQAIMQGKNEKGKRVNAFVEFSRAYLKGGDNGVAKVKLMEPWYYIEALDPYLKGDRGLDGRVKSSDSDQWKWEIANGKTNLDFYMWLEGRSSRDAGAPLKGEIKEFPPANHSEILKLANNRYDFIVTKEGVFRFTPGEDGIRHIGLTNGKPVAFAGEMEIRDGKIITINNHSGHFRPGTDFISFVINALKKAGCIRDGYYASSYGDRDKKWSSYFTYHVDKEFRQERNLYDRLASLEKLAQLVRYGGMEGETLVCVAEDGMVYVIKQRPISDDGSGGGGGGDEKKSYRYPEGKARKYMAGIKVEDKKISRLSNYGMRLVLPLSELQLIYEELQKYGLVPGNVKHEDISQNRHDGYCPPNTYFVYRF